MAELQTVDKEISFEGKTFPVMFKPAEIEFPAYDQMAKAVDAIAAEYQGWEVKPELLKESRAARAQLNKLKSGINRIKIDISNQADAPVKQFKSQIKELLNKIDATSGHIDTQIKELEAKEKADRHNQRLKLIQSLATSAGVDPEKIDYDPRWDLKSANVEAIRANVAKQIETIIVQEHELDEKIKAVEVEANVLGLDSKHWVDLLNTNINSLDSVLIQMKDYKDDILRVAKSQAETKKKEQQDLEKDHKYRDPKTGEVKDKLKSFSMEFYEVNSYQMKQLKKFLIAMGIKFGNARSIKR